MLAEIQSIRIRFISLINTFSKRDKVKVLVVGNSFSRDMACVLLESDYADKIDLSYSFAYKEDLIDRIKQSDYIFSFFSKLSVPNYVWNNLLRDAEVWGIGTKNYGESNGLIYKNRFKSDYFSK